MSESTPRVKHLADYTVPAFLVDEVRLDFDLREPHALVRTRLALHRNPASDERSAPLRLDGEGLELLRLALDGRELEPGEYELDDEGLTLAEVPGELVLESEVRIRPRENTSFEGLFMAGETYCTQCEAEGFRHVTFYPDRPDVMARFRVRIEADEGRFPILLSNGNRVGGGRLPEGRHFAEYDDPFLKPCYLFALVAGDLHRHEDHFTTRSGREVRLEILVEHQNADKCEHAMRSLQKAMKWDEDVYGLECDLDEYKIVAVDEFNMGAMENKGLNVFNSKFVLARPDTATDDDYEAIEGVVAHEYFHNWTGNRVTCRDWFQLSLKEGLTVFRDQEFTADATSRAVKRIADVRLLRTYQFPQDAGPMAHPVRPASYIEMNNFYTVTVYNKGAEVVRMMHTLLGAEGFRKGMELYFRRHDGQAVTCDDFRAALADANGVDLERYERWYAQAGTPVVDVELAYDARARTCTLSLSQSTPATPGQPRKEPFPIPFAVGLLGADGRELPLRLAGEERAASAVTRVLELREERESYTFLDVPERPVPSLLRGFSAPVRVRYERPRAELAFLMAHDSDPFNRWDAGEDYGLQVLLELVEARRAGRALALEEAFVEALRATLADERLDGSLKALALAPPAEAWIAEQMDVVDPDAIHAARRFLSRELARRLRQELLACHRAGAARGPYSFDQAAVARRRLSNACLALLALLEEDETTALCAAQLRDADNMTDAGAALAALASLAAAEREEALASFYERWKDDPLVVDKWFTVQAMADLPDVLERVEALRAHPAYTLANPNRVRALVGAFAVGNFAHFHEAGGAGYAFLAERVLEQDARNPQLASRLVDPLLRWTRYDPGRQDLMRAELERILAARKLSNDVYEKASKALEPAPVA